MNLVLHWFVIYILLSSDVLANVDFYPDVTPEDYVIEELARRILQEEQRRPYGSTGRIPELSPEPEFTYRFPERSSNSEKVSQFAVDPSDPKYYENVNSLRESLFPRQSKSDEDYDRAVLDSGQELKPESPTQRPPPPLQTEGKVAVNHEVLKTLNYVNKESVPGEAQQVYKTIVPVDEDESDLFFVGIVAGCSAVLVVAVIIIGIGWYKFQKSAKAAADVEYPAYGVTGPNKEVSPTSDRRLAQSAQMYHYQHQKQQIIAMESRVTNERNGSLSEAESEEENEEGDYTVYECPGLASTGEMEVKNPLFQDDPTPATPAVTSAPSGTTPTAASLTTAKEHSSSSTADTKK